MLDLIFVSQEILCLRANKCDLIHPLGALHHSLIDEKIVLSAQKIKERNLSV